MIPSRRVRAMLAVLAALLLLAAAAAGPASAVTGGAGTAEEEETLEEAPQPAGDTPFDRQGMWIWYVSHSEGGSIPAIIARARRYGIGTVYVKSGDGATVWSQFNRSLVGRLHRAGIDVCAWQFVYGRNPVAEAKVGAVAARRGADCLVIDAEAEYEGRYAAAETYLRALRARVGASFPLSLASFPYVDYHPAFPYSVFLGPGGAQFNQPQMYWKTIGTSVRTIFEHTYSFNRLWSAPIYPLGQTYEGPGGAGLRMFRRYAASFGDGPPSWWDWQETSGREWAALAATSADRPLTGFRVNLEYPPLRQGARGDVVVWAQEHLLGAGASFPVSGVFGRRTRSAVRLFQEEHGLARTGRIEGPTWDALLAYAPARVRWAASKRGGGARTSRVARQAGAHRPASASLPARGYEIPRGGGGG